MMSAESNSEKSVSYQKKDGRGHARQSFLGYGNDKDLKVCFPVTRVVLHLYVLRWTFPLTLILYSYLSYQSFPCNNHPMN